LGYLVAQRLLAGSVRGPQLLGISERAARFVAISTSTLLLRRYGSECLQRGEFYAEEGIMGTNALAWRMSLLMILGYVTVGMVGCGDQGTGGEDNNIYSQASAITMGNSTCPATTPPSDIFVTKAGLIMVNGMNSSYKEIDFVGDGYPLCFMGIALGLEFSPIVVQFNPTEVLVTMEGSIGQCGLYPDDPVPILSADTMLGPFLSASCKPNDSVSGKSTCVLPPLSGADFNTCLN
jgi:hypothetical protein